MRKKLNDVLAKEGNTPLGDEPIDIIEGSILLRAWEEIEMTINQTIGALTGLEIYERQSNYRDCFGRIYTPASWQAHQVIGYIAVETV